MSSSELQAAKTEYELEIDRHRRLASELEKKDKVIIRHKPMKAAPVVIQRRPVPPPQLEVETITVPKTPLQEETIDNAVTKLPANQEDHTPAGRQSEQVQVQVDKPAPMGNLCKAPSACDPSTSNSSCFLFISYYEVAIQSGSKRMACINLRQYVPTYPLKGDLSFNLRLSAS